jgi:hypothetical protein
MGLDITAFSRVTKLDVELDENDEPVNEAVYEDGIRAYVMGERGQHDHLEDRKFYSYEDAFGFRAGSYSGYNGWREMLAKLAGYPLTPIETFCGKTFSHAAACWNGASGAFCELIDFPDNEGVIGPLTSAKLAKDFAEFDERARTFDAGGDGWSYKQYCNWRKAFEFASDGGMVVFH